MTTESMDSAEVVEIIGSNKSVQQLALNSDQNLPNSNYIYKEGGVGFRDALLPLESIPSTAQQELLKIHSALSSWGFFQATNHGITSLFLEKVREISKQFFELPMEEKQKYAREPNGIEGYGNDVIFSENQRLDWTDRVYLKVHPEDQRNFKVWPQKPNDFRSIVLQYTESLRKLNEVVLRAMAKSLNLEEDCFLNECGERCDPHTDGSSITFVLQDKEVEGLQVLKDNQWFKVPIIPDALVINLGDQLEVGTTVLYLLLFKIIVVCIYNEQWNFPKSNTQSSDKCRKGEAHIATFCVPDSEKEIKPIDKLVNESRPMLYRPVKNFVDIYFEYYQQGRKPIEAAKIIL
ncbi:2-oxoglutarate (2OG) and Fe(II)-dependent oxygenase superfamily protein [Trifolium repens]|nr:2-oxoglutarate (2OG) and Fe(II)-dependent oxygenase superfamily protein [Trifolium repens]